MSYFLVQLFANCFYKLYNNKSCHRYDDLIVGAPFYYTPHSSGAIYVYVNRDGIRKDTKYTKIEGKLIPHSFIIISEEF